MGVLKNKNFRRVRALAARCCLVKNSKSIEKPGRNDQTIENGEMSKNTEKYKEKGKENYVFFFLTQLFKEKLFD